MRLAYPAAPVRALVQARADARGVGVNQLPEVLRVSRRTLQRVMTRDWLRWDTADRMAVALGHHPSELWPDWFTDTKETA